MNTKPVLEIHEWKKEFEKLPLEDYILTFDDGLYSQYQALDFLKTLSTIKIFFISTDIIRPRYQEPNTEIIHCADAHKKAFSDNKEDYMSWKEIQEISQIPGFEIGGHSHYHHKYSLGGLKDLYAKLVDDTERMLKNFKNNNIEINSFCFPYNEDYQSIYRMIITKEGIGNLFGYERIPIESI